MCAEGSRRSPLGVWHRRLSESVRYSQPKTISKQLKIKRRGLANGTIFLVSLLVFCALNHFVLHGKLLNSTEEMKFVKSLSKFGTRKTLDRSALPKITLVDEAMREPISQPKPNEGFVPGQVRWIRKRPRPKFLGSTEYDHKSNEVSFGDNSNSNSVSTFPITSPDNDLKDIVHLEETLVSTTETDEREKLMANDEVFSGTETESESKVSPSETMDPKTHQENDAGVLPLNAGSLNRQGMDPENSDRASAENMETRKRTTGDTNGVFSGVLKFLRFWMFSSEIRAENGKLESENQLSSPPPAKEEPGFHLDSSMVEEHFKFRKGTTTARQRLALIKMERDDFRTQASAVWWSQLPGSALEVHEVTNDEGISAVDESGSPASDGNGITGSKSKRRRRRSANLQGSANSEHFSNSQSNGNQNLQDSTFGSEPSSEYGGSSQASPKIIWLRKDHKDVIASDGQDEIAASLSDGPSKLLPNEEADGDSGAQLDSLSVENHSGESSHRIFPSSSFLSSSSPSTSFQYSTEIPLSNSLVESDSDNPASLSSESKDSFRDSDGFSDQDPQSYEDRERSSSRFPVGTTIEEDPTLQIALSSENNAQPSDVSDTKDSKLLEISPSDSDSDLQLLDDVPNSGKSFSSIASSGFGLFTSQSPAVKSDASLSIEEDADDVETSDGYLLSSSEHRRDPFGFISSVASVFFGKSAEEQTDEKRSPYLKGYIGSNLNVGLDDKKPGDAGSQQLFQSRARSSRKPRFGGHDEVSIRDSASVAGLRQRFRKAKKRGAVPKQIMRLIWPVEEKYWVHLFLTQQLILESTPINRANQSLLSLPRAGSPSGPRLHFHFPPSGYSTLPAADPAPAWRFRTCAVVGDAPGGRHHGERIDSMDIVVRINLSPVEGYEESVGSKTTFNLMSDSIARLVTSGVHPLADLDKGLLRGSNESSLVLFETWLSQFPQPFHDQQNEANLEKQTPKNSLRDEEELSESTLQLMSQINTTSTLSPDLVIGALDVWRRITYDLQKVTESDNSDMVSDPITSSSSFSSFVAPPPTNGWFALVFASQICEQVSMFGFTRQDRVESGEGLRYFDDSSTLLKNENVADLKSAAVVDDTQYPGDLPWRVYKRISENFPVEIV